MKGGTTNVVIQHPSRLLAINMKVEDRSTRALPKFYQHCFISLLSWLVISFNLDHRYLSFWTWTPQILHPVITTYKYRWASWHWKTKTEHCNFLLTWVFITAKKEEAKKHGRQQQAEEVFFFFLCFQPLQIKGVSESEVHQWWITKHAKGMA